MGPILKLGAAVFILSYITIFTVCVLVGFLFSFIGFPFAIAAISFMICAVVAAAMLMESV